MIVVMNKIDMIPEQDREKQIGIVKTKLEKTFSGTRFAGCLMVPVSATPGATDKPGTSFGIDKLMENLISTLQVPKRDSSGKFLFSIDHCFAIKGQGTVLTGTVLRGSISVGDNLEFPKLNVAKKIKSMQMFKKPINTAKQGDRIGICVTQLDSNLIERGIAAQVGSVVKFDGAIVAVNKIRFFKQQCQTKSKFHITVGHSTVMGMVHFFKNLEEPKEKVDVKRAQFEIPKISNFDFSKDYSFEEELYLTDEKNAFGTQFAYIFFEKPILC